MPSYEKRPPSAESCSCVRRVVREKNIAPRIFPVSTPAPSPAATGIAVLFIQRGKKERGIGILERIGGGNPLPPSPVLLPPPKPIQTATPHPNPCLPAAAMAALNAVQVSGVRTFLDQLPERPARVLPPASRCLPHKGGAAVAAAKFLVIGHRGRGMNALASPDRRMSAVKENSVLSFNEAGRFPVDFVEFDVQVTEDGCPVIFHDNFILTEENGIISEKRVTELQLEEFLSYGPQKDVKKIGKSLYRKAKDGGMFSWKVENDDSLCTLEEVFQKVDSKLGFNIELKFDDHLVYMEEELMRSIQVILQVVYEFANERPIIFSSFQPDAAQLLRKLQSIYPVFFLTNGGNEVFSDKRRNSLDEAIKHCLAHGLQGIVSEVRGILRNPTLVPTIKESNLTLLTYGQLNNVAEAVCAQHLMGVDGVIVDLVQEITEVVSDFFQRAVNGEDGFFEEDGGKEQVKLASRP